jgi:hypothetical protein
VFSAFHGGFRRSALRILFPSGPEHGRGFPGASGEVVDYREPTWSLNLHRPRHALFLIETALSAGWAPSRSPHAPLVIASGYELLRAHRPALDLVLQVSGGPPPGAGVAEAARLPDDGRLFQDHQFEVAHLRHAVIEQLIALIVDDRGDLEPTLLYLKVQGQPWQKCFLDVGAGFWEQWSHVDPAEVADDDGIRAVDYAERFGLRGVAILGVHCEREGPDLASRIRLVLATGTLALRPRDPKGIDPCSWATFEAAG